MEYFPCIFFFLFPSACLWLMQIIWQIQFRSGNTWTSRRVIQQPKPYHYASTYTIQSSHWFPSPLPLEAALGGYAPKHTAEPLLSVLLHAQLLQAEKEIPWTWCAFFCGKAADRQITGRVSPVALEAPGELWTKDHGSRQHLDPRSALLKSPKVNLLVFSPLFLSPFSVFFP